VQFRAANHEVGTGLADLNTVEHQDSVVLRDMLPAHLEAVLGEGFQTNTVTVDAVVDTLLHGWIHGTNLLDLILTQTSLRHQHAEDAIPALRSARYIGMPEPIWIRQRKDGMISGEVPAERQAGVGETEKANGSYRNTRRSVDAGIIQLPAWSV
jgi:hypothetical protein